MELAAYAGEHLPPHHARFVMVECRFVAREEVSGVTKPAMELVLPNSDGGVQLKRGPVVLLGQAMELVSAHVRTCLTHRNGEIPQDGKGVDKRSEEACKGACSCAGKHVPYTARWQESNTSRRRRHLVFVGKLGGSVQTSVYGHNLPEGFANVEERGLVV